MNGYRALALLSIALAIESHAQGVEGVVVESTDPAKVAAVELAAREIKARIEREAQSGTPRASVEIVRGRTDGGLEYLSGGISAEDRTTMYAERAAYSLWVATVAKGSGAYLTDAQLRIVDLNRKRVIVERMMDGPWFFLALPSGSYEITATVPPDSGDPAQTLTNRVNIPLRGQRQAVLRFDSSAMVGPEMESSFKGNPFGAPPAGR